MPITKPTLTFPPELLLKAQGVRVVFFDIAALVSGGSMASPLSRQDVKGLELLSRAETTPVVMLPDGVAQWPCLEPISALQRVVAGSAGKLAAATSVLRECGLGWSQAAVMGTDWGDLALMQGAAFSGAPADAHAEVRAVADYVSPEASGRGAVRTFCDIVLVASGWYARLLEEHTR